MAVAAFYVWERLGRPLEPARPIRELVERLRVAYPRAAHTFGWYANAAHYEAVPAEDHTPYSQTGWPLANPAWVVFATDVMHRPDLGVDCNVLFSYWIGEARAGRMPWLKYLNWQGRQYRARGYGGETAAFRTAWSNSGHFDHIHLSGRTDHRATSLGAWSVTPGAEEQDMDEQAAHDLTWTVLGMASGANPIRIPARAGGQPARAIPNRLIELALAQADTSRALAAAVAAIGTSSPEVAALMAQIQAGLDRQTAVLQASTVEAVAGLGEGGAAKVREEA